MNRDWLAWPYSHWNAEGLRGFDWDVKLVKGLSGIPPDRDGLETLFHEDLDSETGEIERNW